MSANSNRPTFEAFVITERTGKKNVWTRIGAVWPNKDGKGFSIQLHALPIDGKLSLREPLPRRDQKDQRVDDADYDDQNGRRIADEDIPY